MKTTEKSKSHKNTVTKVANSVSFSSDKLPNQKVISKDRERYVRSVSSKALSAISA